MVGAGAVVEGRWSAPWSGPVGTSGPDEHLVDAVRAGTRADPLTVNCAEAPSGGG